MNDALAEPLEAVRSGRGGNGRPQSDGRHAHAIAGLQPVARARTSRVHTHLAGTNQPIDMAPRDALQLAEQIVVEPLSRSLGVDVSMARGLCPGAPGNCSLRCSTSGIPALAGGTFLRWIQGRTN